MPDRARLIHGSGRDARIETARLVIAPLGRADAADLAAITDHPAIIDRIDFLAAPFGLDQARALIASDPGFYGIRRAADGCLVGVAGAHECCDGIEIGYWIGPDHQRLGYAREAVAALLASLNGTPVFAECDPGNAISWRFLVSLGFYPTGEAGRRAGRQILCYPANAPAD